MMTLYLTFEALEQGKISPETVLKFSARGEEISKVNKINRLPIVEGDEITVREAIRAVIVKSFNEAAVALAEAVSGNEWEFARKMNKKARELGMINSSFRNSSGLHEEGQYTTSYDLARLAAALQKDFPTYYHLFALKEFEYRGTKYETHNHVLVNYQGAEGMKTGFTNAAGYNLVAAAKKNDARVTSILLGCESYRKRDEMTKKLLDEAFANMAKNPNSSSARLDKNFDYTKHHQRREEYEEEMHFGMALFDE
jgi:D-alanyl-D-alanine carboxypeptidase